MQQSESELSTSFQKARNAPMSSNKSIAPTKEKLQYPGSYKKKFLVVKKLPNTSGLGNGRVKGNEEAKIKSTSTMNIDSKIYASKLASIYYSNTNIRREIS